VPSRIAFSTLAFPDATLAAAASAGRRWGYSGIELRLIDGEVPVREMLGLLTAGGYPHWISVEWEKRWHPEIEAPEMALPQHLDLLATWLESGR
jgi:sugar phosphate isomerase/epimerase